MEGNRLVVGNRYQVEGNLGQVVDNLVLAQVVDSWVQAVDMNHRRLAVLDTGTVEL